jgi:hypothetical protein
MAWRSGGAAGFAGVAAGFAAGAASRCGNEKGSGTTVKRSTGFESIASSAPMSASHLSIAAGLVCSVPASKSLSALTVGLNAP